MTLGRKGLTSGAMKGLTVCCVCVLLKTCCCVFLCCVHISDHIYFVLFCIKGGETVA
ncbi:unnamed protein product, partial [Staurois parvus]